MLQPKLFFVEVRFFRTFFSPSFSFKFSNWSLQIFFTSSPSLSLSQTVSERESVCVYVRVALFVCAAKRCARIRRWQLQSLLVLVFERIFLSFSSILSLSHTHTHTLSHTRSLVSLWWRSKREIHHSRRFFQLATNQLFRPIFNFGLSRGGVVSVPVGQSAEQGSSPISERKNYQGKNFLKRFKILIFLNLGWFAIWKAKKCHGTRINTKDAWWLWFRAS